MSAAPPPVAGVIGLDIGGTTTRGVLLGEDDRVLADVDLPTGHGSDGVLDTAVTISRSLLTDAGVGSDRVLALGAGVPGVVEPGGVVRDAVNLGVADPLPLARQLGDAVGIARVAVDNDLNVAVLGARRLLLPGARDVVLLALGTGLAAGVMLDGVVRRGWSGAVGEVGHVSLDPDGPECACGQRGCLERYVSGAAIARRWGSREGGPAPAELFAAAAAGDRSAADLVEELGAALATAVRLVVLTYDPEHVLIGGGVSRLGEPLLAVLRRHLDDNAASSAFLSRLAISDRVGLVPAAAAIGPVGAALLARERAADPADPVAALTG